MSYTVVVSLEGFPADEDVTFVSDDDETAVIGTLAMMTLGPDPDYATDTDSYRLEVDRAKSWCKVTVKHLSPLYLLGSQGVADVFQDHIARAVSL